MDLQPVARREAAFREHHFSRIWCWIRLMSVFFGKKNSPYFSRPRHSLLHIVAYNRILIVFINLHLCFCELCNICKHDLTLEPRAIGAMSLQLAFRCIQNVFRGIRSHHVHRSILGSNLSSCSDGMSICSLLFDANGLGTRCSLFSRFFLLVFSRLYLNRVAREKQEKRENNSANHRRPRLLLLRRDRGASLHLQLSRVH